MAKINFTQKAQQELSLSELMKGREKLETETLIQLHPDSVIITDFDLCELDKEVVAVYTVKEEPHYFIFGGHILRNLFESFIKEYDGDIDACRADFVMQGGIRVKLEKGKTKNNQPITKVKVL